jgi:hypothetical protein
VKLVGNRSLPLVPTKTQPLEDAQTIINELKAGKVVGRRVLTPV